MKIAIVTNNGKTVSQHFGRAPYFKIIEIKDGKVTGEELRERLSRHSTHNHQNEHHAGGGHGAGMREHHLKMVSEISDCNILIAGGMGAGAYQHFVQAGLEVILTDKKFISDVVEAYLKGELKNLVYERTH